MQTFAYPISYTMITSRTIALLGFSLLLFARTSNSTTDVLYPFLVTIFKDKIPLCSGIVIHKKYVLTTAACVYPRDEQYFVLFGDPKKVRRVGVAEVMHVPNFVLEYHQNDLARLKLVDALPLRDSEMRVKRIPLAQEIDFTECFNVYISKNLEQIIGPTIWSRQCIQPPDRKYNDLTLEIDAYPKNNTDILPMKGSPLICSGRAVGLFSGARKELVSGGILGLFTKIHFHLHWIQQSTGNVTTNDPSESVEPRKPDNIDPPTTIAPVPPESNADKRLQSHLLLLIFIALARYISNIK